MVSWKNEKEIEINEISGLSHVIQRIKMGRTIKKGKRLLRKDLLISLSSFFFHENMNSFQRNL
jgi:hypothetical protein